MVRMLPSKMSWRRYGQSVILVMIATLLGQPIRVFIDPTNLVMLYLLVVVISAVWLGRGPAVLSAFLGVLAFDVFFVPPRFMLGVADTQYLLTFAGLLLVGLVISALAAHASVQAYAARQREQQAIAGYELSRDLAAASEVSELLHVIMSHTARLFACDVADRHHRDFGGRHLGRSAAGCAVEPDRRHDHGTSGVLHRDCGRGQTGF